MSTAPKPTIPSPETFSALYTKAYNTLSHCQSTALNAYWQSVSALWLTMGGLLEQRVAMAKNLAQETPQWQARFAKCTTYAEFMQTYTAYQNHLTYLALNLAADTQAQQTWLRQELKTLNVRSIDAIRSSVQDAIMESLELSQLKGAISPMVAPILSSPVASTVTDAQKAIAKATAAPSAAPAPVRPKPAPIKIPELTRQAKSATAMADATLPLEPKPEPKPVATPPALKPESTIVVKSEKTPEKTEKAVTSVTISEPKVTPSAPSVAPSAPSVAPSDNTPEAEIDQTDTSGTVTSTKDSFARSGNRAALVKKAQARQSVVAAREGRGKKNGRRR